MKPRILLISAISPHQIQGGGSVVLARHFLERDDFEVLEYRPKSFGSKIAKLIPKRLWRTRFSRLLNGLHHDTHPVLSLKDIIKIRKFRPQAVLTVAHGPEGWMAKSVASRFSLPLITFFHDWWPYLASKQRQLSRRRLKSIEKQFLQLYRQSDCSLCVCEGMKEKLGHHNDAPILYPIPPAKASTPQDSSKALLTRLENQKPITIVYAGNMTGGYGKQLRALYQQLKSNSIFRLKLIGNTSDWPEEIKAKAKLDGSLSETMQLSELRRNLLSSDLLLVNMGFDVELPIFLDTSFPSKISTYSEFGKPVIFWAPKKSSISRFAEENGYQLSISTKNPAEFIESLSNSLKSLDAATLKYEAESLRNIFEPSKIQSQLVDAISRHLRT